MAKAELVNKKLLAAKKASEGEAGPLFELTKFNEEHLRKPLRQGFVELQDALDDFWKRPAFEQAEKLFLALRVAWGRCWNEWLQVGDDLEPQLSELTGQFRKLIAGLENGHAKIKSDHDKVFFGRFEHYVRERCKMTMILLDKDKPREARIEEIQAVFRSRRHRISKKDLLRWTQQHTAPEVIVEHQAEKA